jgi:ribosomal protein S18 acetylase RimI-like enzyme
MYEKLIEVENAIDRMLQAKKIIPRLTDEHFPGLHTEHGYKIDHDKEGSRCIICFDSIHVTDDTKRRFARVAADSFIDGNEWQSEYDHIIGSVKRCKFLVLVVAEDGNIHAGCVVYYNTEREENNIYLDIYCLCTSPEFRNQGLARLLIENVYTFAARMRVETETPVWLYLNVDESVHNVLDSDQLVNMYLKFGFGKFNDPSGNYADRIHMRRMVA